MTFEGLDDLHDGADDHDDIATSMSRNPVPIRSRPEDMDRRETHHHHHHHHRPSTTTIGTKRKRNEVANSGSSSLRSVSPTMDQSPDQDLVGQEIFDDGDEYDPTWVSSPFSPSSSSASSSSSPPPPSPLSTLLHPPTDEVEQ